MNCGGEIKSLAMQAPNVAPTSQSNSDGSFGAVIGGIFVLAVFIFLGWQLLSWLFSLDLSSDGEPTRFRIPFRRR